jgi:hypothetical protein
MDDMFMMVIVVLADYAVVVRLYRLWGANGEAAGKSLDSADSTTVQQYRWNGVMNLNDIRGSSGGALAGGVF